MPLQHIACHTLFVATISAVILGTAGHAPAADPPKIDLALSFRPMRPDVPYDSPAKDEIEQCEVRVEREGDVSGWMVLGPQGQLLRRFLDTDGDNVVDQWRFFRNGVEIYRDLDTDGNQKTDQFRFVNEGGSRWGVDENEDGTIDSWKILSAEEASQIAIKAILERDAELLSTVLVSEQDVKNLGLNDELAQQLLKSVANPESQIASVTEGSKVFASGSQWIKLDSAMPGLVPKDKGKAEQDLFVRENAVAILDLQEETGLAQVGEIVRVGDVWKLTQIPRPIEGENPQIASDGLLIQPATTPAAGVPGGISEEMRKLLENLQALDAKAPGPQKGVEAFAKYNARRAEILAGLVEAAESAEDKELWTRQFADSVSAAVSTGNYPDGLQKLAEVEQQLAESEADSALQSYVRFRRLFAEYNKRAQEAGDDNQAQVEVQKWWNESLQKFVKAFPDSPDTSEALLQLALNEEFSGNLDEAAKWYEKLVSQSPDSRAGKKAQGALRRLDLKGKPFDITASGLDGEEISAADFRGQVLLVLFWSTNCRPCEENRPKLLSLYQQYHSQGFEILGVNLDPTAENVTSYIRENNIPWPQVHEAGGMESEPARQFGIITQPTMILVGRDGNVVSRGVSVEDLEASLPKLLQGQ